MKEQVTVPGRDAVLRERKSSKPYLFRHHQIPQVVWWDRIAGYFGIPHWMGHDNIHSMRQRKMDTSLDSSELVSIYSKLKDCCDDDETELKEAIRYGLTVVSGGKHCGTNPNIEGPAASGDTSSRDTHASLHDLH